MVLVSRADWDEFFRDNPDMNEMKAGERPDTIHLENLPVKWFLQMQVCFSYRLYYVFGCWKNLEDSFGNLTSNVAFLTGFFLRFLPFSAATAVNGAEPVTF